MSPDTCKVDRVVEAYGLDESVEGGSVDDRLLARWTGADGRPAAGYRTLTDWFNERLLRRVYDDHGRDSLGGRVDHDYEALTGEDDLVAAEVVESLRADGIDAERVRGDLVSWGTMRTHLKGCLDGEKERAGGSDWERDAVARARSFASEKAESALSSLGSKGRVADVETAAVEVGVQVTCTECPTRVPFDVALDRGYVCGEHADIDASGQGADASGQHTDANGTGETPADASAAATAPDATDDTE